MLAMASPLLAIRPASRCLRQTARKGRREEVLIQCRRSFAVASPDLAIAAAATTSTPKLPPIDPATLDRNTVSTKREERLLLHHQHVHPIGSRRRRALQQSDPTALPFEQMPYQCFQEARKVLAADREEKLAQIEEMRVRIGRVMDRPAAALGGEYVKKGKLVRMQKHLEELKIYADANDPLIKKRFEDGFGMIPLLISTPLFCPLPWTSAISKFCWKRYTNHMRNCWTNKSHLSHQAT